VTGRKNRGATQAESWKMAAVSTLAADRDWTGIGAALDAEGCACVAGVLSREECIRLAKSYDDDSLFRRRVIMAHHGYGSGEYRYFAYPLPGVIAELRVFLYPHLAAVANRWNTMLGVAERYPEQHDVFLERCHRAGQTRPTPLLLRYGPSDYNCLHQDLYGEIVFPLQVTILLSAPGDDFTGGEFVLTEQRPRRQSRVQVVPLQQGDAVIFAVHQRPVRGRTRMQRVNMRHGVSTLRSGQRHALGLIFHDAR